MKTIVCFCILVAVVCDASAYMLARQATVNPSRQYSVSSGWGYIENKGQIIDQNNLPNSAVKYLLNRPGLNVQLKANSFSYDSYSEDAASALLSNTADNFTTPNTIAGAQPALRRYHRVDVELVGANPLPAIRVEEKSDDYLNYYTTGTPEEGVQEVHSYKKIIYSAIYPLIDLEFFLTEKGAMEYQFVVHSGGNPAVIKLRYHGANNTRLDNDKIELSLLHGTLTEHIPTSYIAENGKEVQVRFVQRGSNEYGFEQPQYSLHQTLVIDPSPTLNWGTYYGGGVDHLDQGYGIALESSGNIVVTGWTGSPNAIATGGAYQNTLNGTMDVFILKLRNDGTRLWGTYYGGSSSDLGYGLALDGSGNIIITGWTISANGIATSGSYQPLHGGKTYDAFIAKFNNSGGRVWATYYGGTGNDEGRSIAIDAGGNIFITGVTNSTNAIATSGAHQQTIGGTDDAFVVKFNNNGARVWGSYYGGSQIDYSWGITVDGSGNVLITGATLSAANIATVGAHQSLFSGTANYDAFIAKFNNNGTRIWATYYGGTESDVGSGITTDATGNIYTVGWTVSPSAIATGGAHQTVFAGVVDAFLVKFAVNGERLWGTYYGGEDDDHIYSGVAVDAEGNVLVTGGTQSNTGIATDGSYQVKLNGVKDAFLAKFSSDGTRQWGTYYGGSSSEQGWGIIAERSGGVLITGATSSSNGIATPGAHQTIFAGFWDAFVARFGECFPPTPVILSASLPTVCSGETIQYNIPGSAGNNYQWLPLSKGTILNGTTSASISVKWTQSGIDTIRVRETVRSNGCFKDTFLVVSISPTPIVSLGTDRAICSGESIVLNSSVKGGTGLLSYAWKPATGLSAADVPAPNAKPMVTTEYILTVTDAKGCLSRDTIKVGVGIRPIANAGASATICPDKGVQIGTPAVNGYEYRWQPTTGLSDPTVAQPVATPTVSTTYRLTVREMSSGCTDSSQVLIIVSKPSTTQSVSGLDFEVLGACESYKDRTVEIANVESDDITFDDKNITNSSFRLLDALPFTLSKGVPKTLTIRYNPSSIGASSGMLTLHSKLCDYQVHVNLQGTKEQLEYSSDKPAVAYGKSFACGTTVEWDSIVTIKNAGKEKLTVQDIRIAAPYSVSSPTFPQTLNPGTSLAIHVRYAPTSAGVFDTELLLPIESQSCHDTMRIPLSATHVALDAAVATPSILAFSGLTECNSARDTVVLLHNSNSVDITAKSIISSDPQFTVLTPQSFVISAGGDKEIRLRFQPLKAGTINSTLRIVTEPCMRELTMAISGTLDSLYIAAPDTLNFNAVKKGTTATKTMDIVNTGDRVITLFSLSGITAPFALKKTTPPLPATLQPGDTLKVDVAFSSESGTFNSVMTAIVSQPCPISATTILSAKGKENADTVNTVIGIRDIEGEAGKRVNLELFIAQQANIEILGAPTQFRAKLRYNNTMLYNKQTSNACVNTDSDNGSCEIEVTGARTTTSASLLSIPCILTLGNSDQSETELREFTWTDGSVPIQTQTQNGKLQLTGVCEEGGVRLYISGKVSQSLTSRPIPAQNSLQVQYGLREALTVTLELINATGQVVQTIENNAFRQSGQYTIIADISSIANGVYYLRLTSNKGILTSRVSVVK